MLRRLVSCPRKRCEDLDMAFVTDNIIVMSMPAHSFPETMYRNTLCNVRTFLDCYAKEGWRIFDFRAEGAGVRRSLTD